MSSTATPDSDELSRFRREWIEEVHKKKAAPEQTAIPPSPESPKAKKPPAKKSKIPATTDSVPVAHPALAKDGSVHPVDPTLQKALVSYREAIEHEQKGNLDEALALYRQAFRQHEYVDRAYSREVKLQSLGRSTGAPSVQVVSANDLSASLESVLTLKPTPKSTATSSVATSVTATSEIVSRFSAESLAFEAEDERRPIFLRRCPIEVLILICMRLDHTSLERFGLVCRKARVTTLEQTIWRELVYTSLRPPQVGTVREVDAIVERYNYDFRRLYISRPRVRLDGVYIAICHYVRAGLSENHWVNISHLITYHRYLRFLPNGQVLSLLVNEEQSPQQILPILKPGLRMKGLFIGMWELCGETVHLYNLVDASGRYPVPDPSTIVIGSADKEPDLSIPGVPGLGVVTTRHTAATSAAPVAQRARYVFDMTLALKSRPLGRWNKMDILTYDSIHLETGEANAFPLKNERGFWFSRVKSYT